MLASIPASMDVNNVDDSDFIEIIQIHHCLRNEFTNLSSLVLQARYNFVLRPQALQHFLALKAIYDSHSQVEDDIIFPELVNTQQLCTEACAELDRQHHGQKEIFTQLEILLHQWCSQANKLTDDAVVELADKLRASICLHLNLEEEEILPSLQLIKPTQTLLLGRVIGERSQDLMKLIFAMLERNLTKQSYTRVMQDFYTSTSKTKFSDWEKQVVVVPVATPAQENSLVRVEMDQHRFGGELGCQHYQRGLVMYFECCQRFFPCTKCHDASAAAGHETTFAKRVWCQHCATFQTLSPGQTNCGQCHKEFARYSCLQCNLWENNAQVKIYHCPYCNLCRRGQGLGIDFHHCMTCNRCMSTKLRTHKCVEEDCCMICLQDLQHSNEPNFFSKRCGHVMHQECFKQHLKYDYRCPSCRCSLINMDQTWLKLDSMLGSSVVAQQQQQFSRCNDCGQNKVPIAGPIRTYVERGLVALKVGERCTGCGSYNTLV